MKKLTSPNELYDALRKVIDLPGNVVSLTLRLAVGKAPTVSIEQHVTLVQEIEVTTMDSTARTFRPGTDTHTTQIKRYHLVEISE